MRGAVILAGALLAALGILWIGQGLGYIHWPAQSFMIEQRRWADYGTVVAVFGLAIILAARRLGR